MRNRPSALAIAALSLHLWSCALGGGALSGAGNTALRQKAKALTGGDAQSVRFGASVGAMPNYVISYPEGGAAGTGLGWTLHAGAQLFVMGIGAIVEYQLRQQPLNYAGGYGGGSRAHGVMAFASLAPLGFLSLELGGGPLFGGTFGWLGSCGEMLDDCATSEFSGAASGVRGAARLNVMLFEASPLGGEKFRVSFADGSRGTGYRVNLPLATTLRLEFGYQHLWVTGARPLPASVGSLSFGAELMLAFF